MLDNRAFFSGSRAPECPLINICLMNEAQPPVTAPGAPSAHTARAKDSANPGPHIRADLAAIPAVGPSSGNPGYLKLTANELSGSPSPRALAAITDSLGAVNRYPDFGCGALTRALAAHLGLAPDAVAVGAGSSSLCQALVQICCSSANDEVIFPWRSFEAYPLFAQVAGATGIPVPLTETAHHDFSALHDAITPQTRLIFLCNPNNPTGTTFTQEEFSDFMALVPSSVIVALDEAYVEFNHAADTPNAAKEIHRYPNLVGLRTFSKAYGLAGIRVGYAFGAPAIIEALRKVSIPFAVGSAAQAAAVAALEDTAYLDDQMALITAQRNRVAAHLGTAPSEANFVWLPAAELSALTGNYSTPDELAAALAQEKVLVRAFPEGVRMTVTTADEMDLFLRAWDRVVE